jgi:hypothetical protein
MLLDGGCERRQQPVEMLRLDREPRMQQIGTTAGAGGAEREVDEKFDAT